MSGPCSREAVTPIAGSLIVDCSVHGEIGSVQVGAHEFDELSELWASHVRDAGGWTP